MFFASDNWAGAHPRINAALGAHNSGFATAYGDSEIDRAVTQRFSEIFEREVAVFFVATGTAANVLSLTAYNKSGGIAFCHREAHLIEDECGAAEYLSGGARLHPVDGALGRMEPKNLERAVARFAVDNVHAGRPVSYTHLTLPTNREV